MLMCMHSHPVGLHDSFLVLGLCMQASHKGSGENSICTFLACICDNYQNLTFWLIPVCG